MSRWSQPASYINALRPFASRALHGPRIDDRDRHPRIEGAGAGYADPRILEAVISAQMQARVSAQGFERDGVHVTDEAIDWRLTTCVAWAAAALGRKVTILDVGGSLASVYFRCSPILDLLPIERWIVLEQSHYVDAGTRHVASQHPVVQFEDDLQAVLSQQSPDVVLFLSSLQYLETPISDLGLVCELTHILLIDRLPMMNERAEPILARQKVRMGTYDSEYSLHIFPERLIRQTVEQRMRIISAWADDDRPEKTRNGVCVHWGGLVAVSNVGTVPRS